MSRIVVVGVEGTDSSKDALVWAARAAERRGCTLEVLHAVGFPLSGMEIAYDDAVQQAAKELVEREADRAREAVPGLSVITQVDHTIPGRALTRRSDEAELVVVGSHPMGFMERLLAGSLAYQVAAGARCPVAVVPHLRDEAPGGVVVGADGSADSLAAVRMAALEADRAGVPLHVVHAWEHPAVYVSVDYVVEGFDEQIREAEAVVLGESVAGLAEQYPDLEVEQHLQQGQAATVLLERARDARLVVVGSRGLHGVARMLLGSVSHVVLLHAQCPVLVVRG